MVIEILTAPRRAREIFGEEKKGDWTTPYMKWRVDEMTGKTEPYSDYANGTTSGVNSEWQTRVQYVFQTSITYGDFEVDMSSTAKVNLAASKQRAAANVIDIDQNRFYLLGVAGKEIYGILNDPNLPAAITAGATGTGGSTKWADKTTVQIYNDVLALFAQLSEQSSGLIDKDTPLKLCLSPELAVRLGAATDFNVSVLDMLKRYFTRIDIVTVPELHSMTAGETMFLIAPEVNGQRSGTLAFGEKMRAGRVVPDLSSFRQKFVGDGRVRRSDERGVLRDACAVLRGCPHAGAREDEAVALGLFKSRIHVVPPTLRRRLRRGWCGPVPQWVRQFRRWPRRALRWRC